MVISTTDPTGEWNRRVSASATSRMVKFCAGCSRSLVEVFALGRASNNRRREMFGLAFSGREVKSGNV